MIPNKALKKEDFAMYFSCCTPCSKAVLPLKKTVNKTAIARIMMLYVSLSLSKDRLLIKLEPARVISKPKIPQMIVKLLKILFVLVKSSILFCSNDNDMLLTALKFKPKKENWTIRLSMLLNIVKCATPPTPINNATVLILTRFMIIKKS